MSAQTRRVLLFDVNETMLDIQALEPLFSRWFNDKTMLNVWFANTVLYSQSLTLAGRYVAFGEIGLQILYMLARAHHVRLPADAARIFRERMARLPPHADVYSGLARLQEAGFRLATLTNSDSQTQDKRLQQAGLAEFFAMRLGVESVGAHKPAAHVYQYAARQLQVAVSDLTLVACHAWDIIGAQALGARGIFVARPGNVQPQLPHARADIVVNDFHDLADALIPT